MRGDQQNHDTGERNFLSNGALDEHRAMARPRRESFGHRSSPLPRHASGSISVKISYRQSSIAYLHAANPTATGEVTLLSRCRLQRPGAFESICLGTNMPPSDQLA